MTRTAIFEKQKTKNSKLDKHCQLYFRITLKSEKYGKNLLSRNIVLCSVLVTRYDSIRENLCSWQTESKDLLTLRPQRSSWANDFLISVPNFHPLRSFFKLKILDSKWKFFENQFLMNFWYIFDTFWLIFAVFTTVFTLLPLSCITFWISTTGTFKTGLVLAGNSNEFDPNQS